MATKSNSSAATPSSVEASLQCFEAVNYVMRNPNGFKNFLGVGVCTLIPGIGMMLAQGYSLEVAESLIRNRGASYVDFSFNRLGAYFMRSLASVFGTLTGLFPLLLGAALCGLYALPAAIIYNVCDLEHAYYWGEKKYTYEYEFIHDEMAQNPLIKERWKEFGRWGEPKDKAKKEEYERDREIARKEAESLAEKAKRINPYYKVFPLWVISFVFPIGFTLWAVQDTIFLATMLTFRGGTMARPEEAFALRWGWRFVWRNRWIMTRAAVFYLLISLVFLVVGLSALVIGVLPAGAFLLLVLQHLLYQIYTADIARGGAPFDLSASGITDASLGNPLQADLCVAEPHQ